MKLTNEQEKIVKEAKGHFLVRACPGSGKTFTLAYKALEDIRAWEHPRKGIALLSFTNTAKQEISDEIKKIGNAHVNFPHYVGTIDSFINKYVFFPYISELGFDTTKIEMIGEPYTRNYGWSRAQRCALRLKYEIDGTLFYQASLTDICDDATIEKAKKIKWATIHKSNKFTQADANYYSLKILREKRYITDTVAARFPYLYIDEAQDTTPVHWEILKFLSNSRHNQRFGAIGDPDQSIYGWNGAHPELFIKYEAALKKKQQAYALTDCRRSSQAICNFYFLFSTLPAAPKAIDENIAGLNNRPYVVFYDQPNDIATRIGSFKADLPPDDSYVITSRSISIIDSAARLNSKNPEAVNKNPFKSGNQAALATLHAKSDYDCGNNQASMYRAESVFLNRSKIYNREDYLAQEKLTKRDWMIIVEKDLASLPLTNMTLGDWSTQASTTAKETLLFAGIDFTPKQRRKLDYKNIVSSDFFMKVDGMEAPADVNTVHSVKGKTTDHICLVMNDEQTERMIKVLSGKNVGDSEERRIFYVAITRARKSLTFCVPSKYLEEIKRHKDLNAAEESK